MVDAAERTASRPWSASTTSRTRWSALAREIVESGEIGEVVSFRGIHAEDYMTDPKAPFTWRLDRTGGRRARRSRQPHHLHRPPSRRADRLAGRPDADGAPTSAPSAGRAEARSTVDDEALVRFASGATGSLEASWVKAGRKMMLAFEVTGSKGTVASTTSASTSCGSTRPAAKGREGFKTILAGPDMPFYGNSSRRRATSSASTTSRPSRSRLLKSLGGGAESACPTSARPGRSSAWSRLRCARPASAHGFGSKASDFDEKIWQTLTGRGRRGFCSPDGQPPPQIRA